jgi:hypothetical protein
MATVPAKPTSALLAILTGIEGSEDKLVGAAAERLWVGRVRVAAERAEAEDRLVSLARLVGLAAADDGLPARDAVREAGAALEAGALRAADLRALLLAALAELPLLDLAAARVRLLAGLVVAPVRRLAGLVARVPLRAGFGSPARLPAAVPFLDLARVALRGVLEVFLVSVAVAIEPQFWSLFKLCYPCISDR